MAYHDGANIRVRCGHGSGTTYQWGSAATIDTTDPQRPALSVSREGAIFVLYAKAGAWQGKVSRDAGATWTALAVPAMVGDTVALAAYPQVAFLGLVLAQRNLGEVDWQDLSWHSGSVTAARSGERQGAAAWPQQVAAGLQRANGKPLVVYYDASGQLTVREADMWNEAWA